MWRLLAQLCAIKWAKDDLYHRLLGQTVLLLYVLLRPVHANQALLAVFFRLMATATFAFAGLFYFAPSLILGRDEYLTIFSADQLHTLVLLSLKLYGFAGSISIVFYGIGSVILGYLMIRPGYFPWILGRCG